MKRYSLGSISLIIYSGQFYCSQYGIPLSFWQWTLFWSQIIQLFFIDLKDFFLLFFSFPQHSFASTGIHCSPRPLRPCDPFLPFPLHYLDSVVTGATFPFEPGMLRIFLFYLCFELEVLFCFAFYFIWKVITKREKEGVEGKRAISLWLADSLPKFLQWLGLGQDDDLGIQSESAVEESGTQAEEPVQLPPTTLQQEASLEPVPALWDADVRKQS